MKREALIALSAGLAISVAGVAFANADETNVFHIGKQSSAIKSSSDPHAVADKKDMLEGKCAKGECAAGKCSNEPSK